MKKLSTSLLANLVATKRKELKLTQQDLADATGINRAQISRLEKEDYLPSIPQLEQLGETLGFEPDEVFVDNNNVARISFVYFFTYFVTSGLVPTKLIFPPDVKIETTFFQRKFFSTIPCNYPQKQHKKRTSDLSEVPIYAVFLKFFHCQHRCLLHIKFHQIVL